MEIRWQESFTDKPLNILEVVYSDGSIHEFNAKLWGRTRKKIPNEVFAPLNEYWATLEPEIVLEIECLYAEVYDAFYIRTDLIGRSKEMRDFCKDWFERLISVSDWKRYTEWCNTSGGLLIPEKAVKTELSAIDKREITYFTNEYVELVQLSAFIKTVMPIWGAFNDDLAKVLGGEYIFLSLLQIIQCREMVSMRAYKKLVIYVEGFVGIKLSTTGYSITMGVGGDETSEWLLALMFVRKIVTFNPRQPGDNLASNLFHEMTNKCETLGRKAPNAKESTNNNDQEMSITDKYKVQQRVRPYIQVVHAVYLTSAIDIARSLEFDIDPELVVKYGKQLDMSRTHPTYTRTIVALIMNPIVQYLSLNLIDYSKTAMTIVAVSAVLEHRGFTNIARLLTATPVKGDYTVMSRNTSSGIRFNPLLPDMVKALDHLYRYRTMYKSGPVAGKNPGPKMIEAMVQSIISEEWNGETSIFENVRNEMASLLICQNELEIKLKQGEL